MGSCLCELVLRLMYDPRFGGCHVWKPVSDLKTHVPGLFVTADVTAGNAVIPDRFVLFI